MGGPQRPATAAQVPYRGCCVLHRAVPFGAGTGQVPLLRAAATHVRGSHGVAALQPISQLRVLVEWDVHPVRPVQHQHHGPGELPLGGDRPAQVDVEDIAVVRGASFPGRAGQPICPRRHFSRVVAADAVPVEIPQVRHHAAGHLGGSQPD